MINFSEAVDRILVNFGEVITDLPRILTDSPDKPEDFPVYSYGSSPDKVIHLHKDGAKVPDIIVVSNYDYRDKDWIRDIDFLSGFQEISKGVPIGKYEPVED